jgi:uncharacterized protein (DUF1697 family)
MGLSLGENRFGNKMDNWVALLRGINVGGNNVVPMADLRRLCVGLGWTGVQSYIASGNLVFASQGTAAGLGQVLRQALVAQMGVDVMLIILPGAAVKAALTECPFDPQEGKQVHAFFLWTDPVVDWAFFEALRLPSEALVVQGHVAWLHAPDGIGRSKLAEKFHKVVTGTEMTARNLNTLRKLVEMLDGMDAV